MIATQKLIWTKQSLVFSDVKNLLFAHFQSSHNSIYRIKASDKLKAMAPLLLKMYPLVSFFGFMCVQWISVTEKQAAFSPKDTLARLLYLLSAICHLATNHKPSALSCDFVNSYLYMGASRGPVPAELYTVLMSLMCYLGQQKRNGPEQSILNYY